MRKNRTSDGRSPGARNLNLALVPAEIRAHASARKLRTLNALARLRPVWSAPISNAMSSAPDHTRQFSSVVHDGPSRAGARSMLRPVGFSDEDFQKPVVGIASLWSMVTPCNMHIDKLAVERSEEHTSELQSH